MFRGDFIIETTAFGPLTIQEHLDVYAAGGIADAENSGGRHGTRTHDPGVANAVLSQLS